MTVPFPPGGPPHDPYKVYDAIWQNMARENDLINHRNQWAIILSAGILATEAALLVSIREPAHLPEQSLFYGGVLFLLFVLSSLAVYFCHRSVDGVMAAQNQLDYLKRKYSKWGDDNENYFQMQLNLPRPFGNPHDHYRGNATAVTFPKVMFVFWLIFSVLQFAGAIVYLSEGVRGVSQAIHIGEKNNPDDTKNAPATAPRTPPQAPSVTIPPTPPPPPENREKPRKSTRRQH